MQDEAGVVEDEQRGGPDSAPVPGLKWELSFQMWTNQMQDMLNSKKGDNAFRQKDFTTTIDFYSQV